MFLSRPTTHSAKHADYYSSTTSTSATQIGTTTQPPGYYTTPLSTSTTQNGTTTQSSGYYSTQDLDQPGTSNGWNSIPNIKDAEITWMSNGSRMIGVMETQNGDILGEIEKLPRERRERRPNKKIKRLTKGRT